MNNNWFLLFSLFFGLSLFGQNEPIQVTTIISPPYPQTYEDALGMGNNGYIVLTNTDQANPYEVKLTLSVTSDAGISFETSPEAVPTQPILLAPGETRSFFGSELEALYLNYNVDDITYSGIDLEEVAQNPYLPEGTYVMCVRAWDYNTAVPLSNTAIGGCAAPIFITTIAAPIITTPFQDQMVNAITPQQVIFNWTPVLFTSPNLRYAIQIADMTDINANPYDILEQSDFLFFSAEDLPANTYVFGASDPALQVGHEYAVRVKAYLTDGTLNIENGGFSEIVQFTYGDDIGNNWFNPIDPFFNGDPIVTDVIDNNWFFDPAILDINYGGYGIIDDEDDGVNSFTQVTSTDLGCQTGCIPVEVQSGQSTAINNGATIYIGNFELEVNSSSGTTSNGYSGSGVIKATSFFPYPVSVNFSNLKINPSGQVMSGTASAAKRSGSWLTESWNNIEKNFNQFTHGNTLDEIIADVQDPDYYLEQWNTASQLAAITLPAGYGDKKYKVQITEINFGPTEANFDAMVMVPMPDNIGGTKALVFSGENVCISPSGPAIGNNPITFNLSSSMRFDMSEDIALAINPSNTAGNSYVNIDCNGFSSATIEGQVLFSPEMIIAENANGQVMSQDTVVANISAQFEDWSEWIGEVNFTEEQTPQNGKIATQRFQYKQLKDYTFEVESAVFDHDINQNYEGMNFPQDYEGATDASWEGLKIGNLNIILPKWAKDDANDERLFFQGENLLMDGTGLSGVFTSENLTELANSSVGGWGFSIDNMLLKIVSNSLQEGDFDGEIMIPVSDDPLAYSANIQYYSQDTHHNFVVATTDTIGMPGFLSTLSLDPNSSLTLDVDNDVVAIAANLNGSLDLPKQIGNIPGCDIKNVSFQDLNISNQPDYLSFGSFGTGNTNLGMTIAGFGVGLVGIAAQELSDSKFELGFDLNVTLGTEFAEVSGTSSLFMLADLIYQGEDYTFEHDRAGVDAFEASGDLPGVSVNAMVEFFNQENLGSGFAGSFTAQFLEACNVSATVMFGSKEVSNETKKFFLVEGMGMSPAPIPIAPPVSIYGFGGGLFYNIKPNFSISANDIPTEESEPNEINGIAQHYQFEEGYVGIKAATVLAITPKETFNADAALTVGIDIDDLSLEMIHFEGNGYMFSKITERDNSVVEIDLDLLYSHSNTTLSGNLGVVVEAPKEEPLVTANGNIEFYASPETWFIKFGTPVEPIFGTVDLKVIQPNYSGYLMVGHDLPAPVLPVQVQEQFPNYDPSFMASSVSAGAGVAFGIHANINMGFDIFIVGVDINVLAGLDVTVASYQNALCNGYEDFGFNRWYAMSQGYIVGTLDFDILGIDALSVNTGVLVEAALPNPTGIKGHLVFEIETFFKDFRLNHSFTIGERCLMEPQLNEDGSIVINSPLEEMEFIESITPSSQLEDVALDAPMKIKYHTNPYGQMTFDLPDGVGGVVEKTYKFDLNVEWTERINGQDQDINYGFDFDENTLTATYTRLTSNGANEFLSPSTFHSVTCEVSVLEKKSNGQFEQLYFTSGSSEGLEVKQTALNIYRTADKVTEINEAHIEYHKPFNRQRYVTIGDYAEAYMKFNWSYSPIFDSYVNEGYEFEAEFRPVDQPFVEYATPITYDENLMATFDISGLSPEKIYEVSFVAVKNTEVEVVSNSINVVEGVVDGTGLLNDNSNNINLIDNNNEGEQVQTATVQYTLDKVVMYRYHFATSKFNTLQDKMATYQIVGNSVNTFSTGFSPNTNPSYAQFFTPELYTAHNITLQVSGAEPLDMYDIYGHPYVNSPFTQALVKFQYDGSPSWYDPNYLAINDIVVENAVDNTSNINGSSLLFEENGVIMLNDNNNSSNNSYESNNQNPFNENIDPVLNNNINSNNNNTIPNHYVPSNAILNNHEYVYEAQSEGQFLIGYRPKGVSKLLTDYEVTHGTPEPSNGAAYIGDTYSNANINSTTTANANIMIGLQPMELIFKGDYLAKYDYLMNYGFAQGPYLPMNSGDYSFRIAASPVYDPLSFLWTQPLGTINLQIP